MERPIEFYTLPNGIRVLHIYDDSPVAYCGIGIHAGTRDEVDDSQSGMAHFIEHCVFKGTQRRKSWNILNRLEDVGGDTNAYTEKEETFVYATVLDEFYERAMDLCTDIVLHPTFPQKELDHEKEVIIDEINSYNDSPSELIYDDFESLVFNNVGLGRNILGKEEVLSHYTTDDALRYYTARYGTNQMIFFSMGRMTQKMLHRLDDKYLRCEPARICEWTKADSGIYHPQHLTLQKELHQVNYLAGNRAYNMFDAKRYPFFLLNNILGGPGMNSRLNLAIREKNGMSYSVESSFTPYSDSGIVFLYFSADIDNKERCISLLKRELKRLREEPLTATQLLKAKRQLLGQLAIADEGKENLALNIAKTFLYFGRYNTLEQRAALINPITSSQLMEVANEVLTEDSLSEIIYE
jgi:predicted Zn-dependent peptidase